MCIIVFKPWSVPVDSEMLRTCFENNPDGAGYMFPCEGRLRIQKGFFTFRDFQTTWEKTRKIQGGGMPVVFHFRIATAGRIDETNCHPHRITRDLGFVHNGILSCVPVPRHGRLSDTILYRDRYLANLTGRTLHNANFFAAISRHIGAGNKFVFMSGTGKVVICNEEQGIWKDGLWFSNHSFLPRSTFPFPLQDGEWRCEYCGSVLETPEEFAEGACRECLASFEPDGVECGGCHGTLFTDAHRVAGWCDECGFEIYGRDWSRQLREAASRPERRLADCF